MGGIHTIRCVRGSKRERKFLELMDRKEVKRELLICKTMEVYKTDYDEYVISDGLYKTIEEEFEKIREI